MKILPIGDSHSKPGVSNERYKWLGRFIVDHQPDVIVEMGDWYDMESLSSYDRGKKSFEGRRYKNDIECGNKALELLELEIDRYNQTRKDRKIAQYRPIKKKLQGNHEERILRAVELHAELEGAIGYKDFSFADHGWETHDYMKAVFIENIAFSHCIGSGIENRPIGGEKAALTLLQKKFMSAVVGHSHVRDFAEKTAENGRKLCGLVAGCYLGEGQYEAYAGVANLLWWKGLVMMEDVKDGMFDPHFYGMSRIKATYG